MADSVRVRAPASSANLGPGFDSFAAALSMHVEVEVVGADAFAVVTDLDVPADESNLVVRGFAAVADPAGREFRIGSSIPLSGGLGSSAAAVLAGALAARELTGADADVLEITTRIEGHPDNAAASLYGGFVICRDGAVVTLGVPAGLSAVLAIPHAAVATEQARGALPETVPLADAVANLSRAATLAIGIERGDLDLIAASLGDELHQSQRASLFPESTALLARAADYGALGATISGAGPSVLFWCQKDAAAEAEARIVHDARGWADVRRADFEASGARVL